MNTLEMQQQLADQRRGRYVRVSDTDRRQLIDTYKKGEDFIALAKKLNIKRSTARSILRTYIDEGRVSAKQRAGTRLRFITEDEAEMIREMKRRHPLITIGQIQMRLQRTSNRVLSKASISRILTNSIRLGKRAKRSNGEFIDEQDGMNEFTQLSSDDGTGGGVYIDDGVDDDDDDDEQEMLETNATSQNLDDFQRFMLRKTSVNGDESMENDDLDGYDGANYARAYGAIGSEDEDDLSETDENETKSSGDNAVSNPENPPTSNENDSYTQVKTEPVCVFVNRNFDSSDSEAEPTNDETISKTPVSAHSTANRRIKVCPICGEQNFSRLSHHLTVAHNLNRAESLALLAYPDRNNNNTHSSIATVSGSSPINSTGNQFDKSPQQTPISINTNNQQITSTLSSPSMHDTENHVNLIHSSPTEQQSANGMSIDGKKRLLCPRCDTWVLNLTDHLIKKHHLVSKQERLPFLRLARNRQSIVNGEKSSTNSFLISPHDHHQQQQQINSSEANKKYQNIIKKYQKKPFYSHPASSSSSSTTTTTTLLNQESSATNSNQNLLAITNPTNSSKQISPSRSSSKDGNIHQKFEQRLSVFRQQFAVTVALQNSLMQQMELLQKSFVSIEDEWNDMKNEIVESIS